MLQPKPLPSPSPLRNLELPLLQEEDDGDDDNENSFSISKIKAETVGLDSFLDDDLNDDEIKTKLLTSRTELRVTLLSLCFIFESFLFFGV